MIMENNEKTLANLTLSAELINLTMLLVSIICEFVNDEFTAYEDLANHTPEYDNAVTEIFKYNYRLHDEVATIEDNINIIINFTKMNKYIIESRYQENDWTNIIIESIVVHKSLEIILQSFTKTQQRIVNRIFNSLSRAIYHNT
jgi:hypothetical protein